jgi:hypothetical protein
LGAAQVAAALESLSAAAVSATWRCRHGAGVTIGEGAVDFASHRSRATVIRGKSTYEYVRSGSSAYRAAVVEDDADPVWETFSEHDACGVHTYAEPAVLAAGVRSAGAVQARDMEEFDGLVLAAYAVTLKPKPADPDRMMARLARQLRDHGANVIVVTAFADESAADGKPDESEPVGDGSDGGGDGASRSRIVRLRIELPHWTPADDPTADHAVTVDLFDFGDPVEIELPEGQGAQRRTARSCADLALF